MQKIVAKKEANQDFTADYEELLKARKMREVYLIEGQQIVEMKFNMM